MSNSSKTNIKTVILATLKAPLAALHTYVDNLKEGMILRSDTQDTSITNLQSHVTELQTTVSQAHTEILKYNSEVTSLKENQFSREQVDELAYRVKELNWICMQLYNIVYDFKTTGSSSKPMPDFNHPIVTRDELLTLFKEEQNIPEDQELTEEEQIRFENFIIQWFLDNPGHVFEEDLES